MSESLDPSASTEKLYLPRLRTLTDWPSVSVKLAFKARPCALVTISLAGLDSSSIPAMSVNSAQLAKESRRYSTPYESPRHVGKLCPIGVRPVDDFTD